MQKVIWDGLLRVSSVRIAIDKIWRKWYTYRQNVLFVTCKGLLAPREESGKNRLQNKGLLNTLIPGGVVFVLVAPVGHFLPQQTTRGLQSQ